MIILMKRISHLLVVIATATMMSSMESIDTRMHSMVISVYLVGFNIGCYFWRLLKLVHVSCMFLY